MQDGSERPGTWENGRRLEQYFDGNLRPKPSARNAPDAEPTEKEKRETREVKMKLSELKQQPKQKAMLETQHTIIMNKLNTRIQEIMKANAKKKAVTSTMKTKAES